MHIRRAHWAALMFVLLASAAQAEVGLLANGRRVQVDQPAKDSKGVWMGALEGRRQRLAAADVVVLVADDRTETLLAPTLSEAELTPTEVAVLAELADPSADFGPAGCEALALEPKRAAHKILLELAGDRRKGLRSRAVTALLRLRTLESCAAAAKLVLDEKDVKSRRAMAAALFSARALLQRCDLGEAFETGLTDSDALVRVEFALCAPHEHPKAIGVLVKDGLRHADHHVRESAALDLGRRGDKSGLDVLLAILGRSKPRDLDTDPETELRLHIAEQVEVCEVLGGLGGESAKSALKKAKSDSPHEAVRKAAEAALR